MRQEISAFAGRQHKMTLRRKIEMNDDLLDEMKLPQASGTEELETISANKFKPKFDEKNLKSEQRKKGIRGLILRLN